MANTSSLYARIDSNLKEDAEKILAQLGISPSSAIQMLYSQIVLNRALPFTPRLPRQVHSAESVRELADAVKAGLDDIETENVYTQDKADEFLKRKYGI